MNENSNIITEKNINKIASTFKILSEISRLKIIKAIIDKELCVKDIVNKTGLQQANVSKQLRYMQQKGILECKPENMQRFYSIKDDTIIKLCKTICENK